MFLLPQRKFLLCYICFIVNTKSHIYQKTVYSVKHANIYAKYVRYHWFFLVGDVTHRTNLLAGEYNIVNFFEKWKTNTLVMQHYRNHSNLIVVEIEEMLCS